MAEEGLRPLALRRVLPQRRTQWVAIVAIVATTTVAAMLLVATGTLAVMAETASLLLLFAFISTNLAARVMRPDPVARAHVCTPTVVPALAIGSSLVLMTQQSAEHWLRAGLLLGAGLVMDYLSGARHRADATAS